MNDLIERQVAIDGLEGHYIERINLNDWHSGWNAAIDWMKDVYLDELPSVQPEMNMDEWCTDCKEYDHEKHCCPRWNRVIRQTLKDAQLEIVRCKDCKHRGEKPISDGRYWCNIHGAYMYYCSDAERRTDE